MSRLADIVAAFEAELGDPAVDVAIGRKELVRHEQPPRIVFVPRGGSIGSTTEIGRRDVGDFSTRTLHERALRCEIYCWGRDFGETEQMLHNAVVALRRAALGSYQLGEEQWITESDDGYADLLHGDMVMVESVITMPVIDAIKPIGGSEQFIELAHPSTITHAGIFSIPPEYGWVDLNYGGGELYGGGKDQVC